jgi:ribosomal-protein-serine acetyltransferase
MNHESVKVDENLQLEQLTPEHAGEMFSMTDENREYLGKFMPWVPFIKTPEDSLNYINDTIESRKNGTKFSYGLVYDGTLAGNVSLRNLNHESRPPEIGYWIIPEYSGKGITTRAVRALTDLGLNSLDLDRIILRANPDNVPSNKVAEKAGYQLVDHEIEDGEPLNVWSISK